MKLLVILDWICAIVSGVSCGLCVVYLAGYHTQEEKIIYTGHTLIFTMLMLLAHVVLWSIAKDIDRRRK